MSAAELARQLAKGNLRNCICRRG